MPTEREQAGSRVTEWEIYREQPGGKGSGRSADSGVGPIEQLRLTGGYSTDYLWYTTTVAAAESYRVVGDLATIGRVSCVCDGVCVRVVIVVSCSHCSLSAVSSPSPPGALGSFTATLTEFFSMPSVGIC